MPEQKNDATYFFATLGARTQRGGRVTKVSTHIECDGLAFARVGDIVTCEDGSEASIVDGAGFAEIWDDKPLALVGSSISNGDQDHADIAGRALHHSVRRRRNSRSLRISYEASVIYYRIRCADVWTEVEKAFVRRHANRLGAK